MEMTPVLIILVLFVPPYIVIFVQMRRLGEMAKKIEDLRVQLVRVEEALRSGKADHA